MRHSIATRDVGCFLASLAICLSGCGGGGSGSPSTSPSTASLPISAAKKTDLNVVEITVEAGPRTNVNVPYVSVTVCKQGGVVGSNACMTIDHVLVDTGSIGLRLFASQINPTLTLPAHTINGTAPILECAQFVNTMAWGSVKVADIVIGGERASSVPVQLMDNSYPSGLNTLCGSSPVLSTTSTNRSVTPPNGTNALSANGILGVGLFASDGQTYFNCASPGSACQLKGAKYPTTAQQVQNPVSRFGVTSSNGVSNNNGVIVQLPTVDPRGVSIAKGYLIFGVGTQTNNQLGSAYVLNVDRLGQFTTVYAGNNLAGSVIDSGSNGLYFDDTGLSTSSCSSASTGFFCPPDTRNLTASIQLGNIGGNVNVNFSIANADNLFYPGGAPSGNFAFNNLGGTFGGLGFDWGLPFFFGRSVYTVIQGMPVNSGTGTLTGPFYAFTN